MAITAQEFTIFWTTLGHAPTGLTRFEVFSQATLALNEATDRFNTAEKNRDTHVFYGRNRTAHDLEDANSTLDDLRAFYDELKVSNVSTEIFLQTKKNWVKDPSIVHNAMYSNDRKRVHREVALWSNESKRAARINDTVATKNKAKIAKGQKFDFAYKQAMADNLKIDYVEQSEQRSLKQEKKWEAMAARASAHALQAQHDGNKILEVQAQKEQAQAEAKKSNYSIEIAKWELEKAKIMGNSANESSALAAKATAEQSQHAAKGKLAYYKKLAQANRAVSPGNVGGTLKNALLGTTALGKVLLAAGTVAAVGVGATTGGITGIALAISAAFGVAAFQCFYRAPGAPIKGAIFATVMALGLTSATSGYFSSDLPQLSQSASKVPIIGQTLAGLTGNTNACPVDGFQYPAGKPKVAVKLDLSKVERKDTLIDKVGDKVVKDPANPSEDILRLYDPVRDMEAWVNRKTVKGKLLDPKCS